ncbi:MAG: RNA polymerase sigma factor [Deltaproteobacteria bacterium]|nr:RNA polymerase sigma factor [Deltaproteobacteria bacterium]
MNGTFATTAKERGQEANLLVQAARSGDVNAFSQLVMRYRSRVFALALHMTGSSSDADDITQDVFVRAYIKIRDFEERSAFFTWLYRITINRALNCRRDQKRIQKTVDGDDDRVRMAVAVDAHGDPQLALELRESYSLLVRALDQLTPILRTTVVLIALQGLSYKEAAVVLGSTEGTIAWRIHEARARLNRFVERMTKEPTPLPRHKRSVAEEELRGLISGLRLDSIFPEPVTS